MVAMWTKVFLVTSLAVLSHFVYIQAIESTRTEMAGGTPYQFHNTAIAGFVYLAIADGEYGISLASNNKINMCYVSM